MLERYLSPELGRMLFGRHPHSNYVVTLALAFIFGFTIDLETADEKIDAQKEVQKMNVYMIDQLHRKENDKQATVRRILQQSIHSMAHSIRAFEQRATAAEESKAQTEAHTEQLQRQAHKETEIACQVQERARKDTEGHVKCYDENRLLREASLACRERHSGLASRAKRMESAHAKHNSVESGLRQECVDQEAETAHWKAGHSRMLYLRDVRDEQRDAARATIKQLETDHALDKKQLKEDVATYKTLATKLMGESHNSTLSVEFYVAECVRLRRVISDGYAPSKHADEMSVECENTMPMKPDGALAKDQQSLTAKETANISPSAADAAQAVVEVQVNERHKSLRDLCAAAGIESESLTAETMFQTLEKELVNRKQTIDAVRGIIDSSADVYDQFEAVFVEREELRDQITQLEAAHKEDLARVVEDITTTGLEIIDSVNLKLGANVAFKFLSRLYDKAIQQLEAKDQEISALTANKQQTTIAVTPLQAIWNLVFPNPAKRPAITEQTLINALRILNHRNILVSKQSVDLAQWQTDWDAAEVAEQKRIEAALEASGKKLRVAKIGLKNFKEASEKELRNAKIDAKNFVEDFKNDTKGYNMTRDLNTLTIKNLRTSEEGVRSDLEVANGEKRAMEYALMVRSASFEMLMKHANEQATTVIEQVLVSTKTLKATVAVQPSVSITTGKADVSDSSTSRFATENKKPTTKSIAAKNREDEKKRDAHQAIDDPYAALAVEVKSVKSREKRKRCGVARRVALAYKAAAAEEDVWLQRGEEMKSAAYGAIDDVDATLAVKVETLLDQVERAKATFKRRIPLAFKGWEGWCGESCLSGARRKEGRRTFGKRH